MTSLQNAQRYIDPFVPLPNFSLDPSSGDNGVNFWSQSDNIYNYGSVTSNFTGSIQVDEDDNEEVKYWYKAHTSPTPTLAGSSLETLVRVARGTNVWERQGDSINIFQISVSCTFEKIANTAMPFSSVCLVILLDRCPRGTTPTLGDIYTATDGISPLKIQSKDRYFELYRKDFAVGWGTILHSTLFSGKYTQGIRYAPNFSLDYRDNPIRAIFDPTDSTGAISPVITNSIYICLMSTLTTNVYSCSSDVVLFFKDP